MSGSGDQSHLGPRRSSYVKLNLGVLRWNLRMVVVLIVTSQHVLLVGRVTIGIIYWVAEVASDIVKMDRRWRIVLVLLFEEERVSVTTLEYPIDVRAFSNCNMACLTSQALVQALWHRSLYMWLKSSVELIFSHDIKILQSIYYFEKHNERLILKVAIIDIGIYLYNYYTSSYRKIAMTVTIFQKGKLNVKKYSI